MRRCILENNGVERTVDAGPATRLPWRFAPMRPSMSREDVLERRNSGQNLDAWLAKLEKRTSDAQEV